MGPEQLGRLVDDHAAALVLYAGAWSDAADDIVQEAFIKLARQRKPPDNPVAWLYRVVRNGAISALRSSRRRKTHESAAAARTPTWFNPTESGLDAEAVTEALVELPVDLREIVIAHGWGGQTFEQIGELIGSSGSTAHRRYLAALEALRERLETPCPKSIVNRLA